MHQPGSGGLHGYDLKTPASRLGRSDLDFKLDFCGGVAPPLIAPFPECREAVPKKPKVVLVLSRGSRPVKILQVYQLVQRLVFQSASIFGTRTPYHKAMADTTPRQIALVTGGGSGISLAFVKKIHEAGYHVLIADLTLHPTASTWIGSLQPSDADRVKFFKLDVTDWAQLEAAFDYCVKIFNGIPTVVVPGAGVYEPSSNSFWEDRDSDSRYKVLDINLVHPIKTTRIAVRRLVEADLPGTIIHLSSIAAQRSSIITPLYTASKHALSSFVRGMAPLAQTSGIRVLGVAPG